MKSQDKTTASGLTISLVMIIVIIAALLSSCGSRDKSQDWKNFGRTGKGTMEKGTVYFHYIKGDSLKTIELLDGSIVKSDIIVVNQ